MILPILVASRFLLTVAQFKFCVQICLENVIEERFNLNAVEREGGNSWPSLRSVYGQRVGLFIQWFASSWFWKFSFTSLSSFDYHPMRGKPRNFLLAYTILTFADGQVVFFLFFFN